MGDELDMDPVAREKMNLRKSIDRGPTRNTKTLANKNGPWVTQPIVPRCSAKEQGAATSELWTINTESGKRSAHPVLAPTDRDGHGLECSQVNDERDKAY